MMATIDLSGGETKPQLELEEAAPAEQPRSSMDIEQSVPTLAELRGKSDNEDLVVPSRRKKILLYSCIAISVAIVVIVSIAVGVTSGKNDSGSPDDLRNMDPSDSFVAVVDYLSNHSISEYPELVREGTYQNMAAKWMAHGDPHSRQIPQVSPAAKQGYSFMQRYIMALLYYQMGGKGWSFNLNFLLEENTCDWHSVLLVEQATFPMGVLCNDNELVEAIVLVDNKVVGSFPPEVGKLSTLRVLEMDLNDISGSIPAEFHKLEALENLHLSHNKLTGVLPSFLGSLRDLMSIDVSFNTLEGTLPLEVATTMESLRGIAVDHNLFTGQVPFWDSSLAANAKPKKNLEYIFLERNHFEGIVGGSMVNAFPNLKVFDISSNQFRGPVPPDIFRLKSLLVLDLHDNAFTGTIPHEVPENATSLQYLALHQNELSGKINKTIGNLQALVHLDVSINKLTGIELSQQTGFGLASLKELRYLFLSVNNFPANPMPEWIRGLSDLKELSVKSLSIDGSIPTWLGDLGNLVLLDLDDNDFRGGVPSELGLLSDLQFLLLNRNELTEELPSELGRLSALRLLYLDRTEVSGDLSMICDRKSPLQPIITADCGGATPEVGCSCCQLCCQDGEECHDDGLVPSNDPMWQFSYDRVVYSFGNLTGYFFAVPP